MRVSGSRCTTLDCISRPYAQPHMPLAVAAAGSPSGMVLAGKFGLGVLSVAIPRGEESLRDFWGIAEQTAAEHGKTVSRDEWRLVIHVHLAETREQALAEVRTRSGTYWRDYFEDTVGFPRPFESSKDQIVDGMVERHTWCVWHAGRPDRHDPPPGRKKRRLRRDPTTGVDWATREQIMHSYELIARYVKPLFQGSLDSLRASQADAAGKVHEVRELRQGAVDSARASYLQHTAASPPR